MRSRNGCWLLALGLWIYAFGVAPSGLLAPALAPPPAILAATLAGMASLFAAMGLAVTNRALGILMNGRNVYSLARLQMVLWTALIIGALLAAAAMRAWAGLDVLAISIPNQLLAAMGVSFASAAAAPGLLALKSGAPATCEEVVAAESRLGAAVAPSGRVLGRPSPAEAVISDLIKGDELSNAGVIDFSKVQQLLVTLLLVCVYLDLLVGFFGGPAALAAKARLPDFDSSFVDLLLISHGGYLAYKAVSKPTDTSTALQRPPAPDRNAELQA